MALRSTCLLSDFTIYKYTVYLHAFHIRFLISVENSNEVILTENSVRHQMYNCLGINVKEKGLFYAFKLINYLRLFPAPFRPWGKQ